MVAERTFLSGREVGWKDEDSPVKINRTSSDGPALMDQQVSQATHSKSPTNLSRSSSLASESEPDQRTGQEIERDIALATSKLGLEYGDVW